jgi:hypothetical protein
MTTLHKAERSSLPSTRIAIRHAHNAGDAEKLLPRYVLDRLCPEVTPHRMRQRDVYRSHVIVAFVDDAVVGFAAHKSTPGPFRIAHDFWVDRRARAGLAAVTHALLNRLEFVVRAAACSRLVVVLPAATPLRPVLERSGFRISPGGANQLWFEKRLVEDNSPLESA